MPAGEDDEEDDAETGDAEEDAMEITLAKGERAPAKAVPVKAKSVTHEEDDDEEEEEDRSP